MERSPVGFHGLHAHYVLSSVGHLQEVAQSLNVHAAVDPQAPREAPALLQQHDNIPKQGMQIMVVAL